MPFDENDENIQSGGVEPTSIGVGQGIALAATLGAAVAYQKYRESDIRKSIFCKIENNITTEMLDNSRETYGKLFLFSIHGVTASFIIKEIIRTKGKIDLDDDSKMKILTDNFIKCIIRSLRKEISSGNGNKKCFLDKHFNELENLKVEKAAEVLNAIKNLVNCQKPKKRKEQIEIVLKAFKIIEMIKNTIKYAAKKIKDVVDNGALYLLDKLIEKYNPKGNKAIYEKNKAKNDTGYEGYRDMCHVLFTHVPSTNYQLFGIPFLLHTSMNTSIKLLNKKGYSNISNVIRDVKLIPCFRLLDAFIKDTMAPINEQIQQNLKKLLYKNSFTSIIETIETQIDCTDKAGKKEESVFLCKKNCCCLGVNEYNIVRTHSGGALIGEGTFGCVFRPHIKCKNLKKKKVEYVTKLIFESNKEIIEREMKLTEKIKKIPNYQDYFAPIEEICDADMSKFSERDKKDCKLINKKTENKYIKKLANLQFIEGDDLIDTLKKSINQKDSFIYFLTMYEQILHSLQLLINKKIVHFDIKANNMIYNIKKNKTFIFDFGLSFDIGNIINLEDIFYVEWAPEWTLWPVEVHYLGFVVSKKRKMLDSEIELFAKEYTNKHSVFRKLNNLISGVFIKSYKDKIIKILNFYNNKQDNINDIISYIINSTWKTWDNYSLNIMFFRFLNVINIIGYSNNEFYKSLVKMFNNNISPIPSERNSIKKTKKKFQNIKKLLTPQILKKASKNINKNRIIIEKTLNNDSKKRNSINQKIINLRI